MEEEAQERRKEVYCELWFMFTGVGFFFFFLILQINIFM